MKIGFCLVFLFGALPVCAVAQSADGAEHGAYRLYKLQQRVGEAEYTLRSDSGLLVMSDTSLLSFLGSTVPLASTLRMRPDFTPVKLVISGATSTVTSVDASVEIAGDTAAVLDAGASRRAPVPQRFFTMTPYPPPGLEQMLFRYWERHGRPPRLSLLPAGDARFEQRGRDTVQTAAGPVVLDRFAVHGVVWGLQVAWFDADGHLIASVGGDAELDRLEVIRDGFEAALPLFVRRGVEDGLADLTRLARDVHPLRIGTFAIVGARLIDGTGKPPIDSATVVIRDGRIAAAGPRAEVAIPPGAAVVPAAGLTVMPGLWDMHVHYEQVEWPAVSLAAGVTTVRDVGNEFELVTALRDAVAAGRILGPRILAAGLIDGGPRPAGVITAGTDAEARAAVRRYHDAGFQQIKIYQSVPPPLVPVIAAEAHALGMTVTGHVPTGMNAYQFVEAGADMINHLGFVTSIMRPRPEPGRPAQPVDLESAEAQRAIQFLVAHHTVIDPSLARSEEFSHRKGAYDAVEPGVALAPPELAGPLQSTGRDSAGAERALANLDRSLHIVGALYTAGIPIILGTDLSVPGHSIYRELELAVRGGLTPMQAIQAATIVPARAMRLEQESGTIEAGKRADLLIVDGDPLADISAVRRVKWVVANGRMYDPAPLWRSAGFRSPVLTPPGAPRPSP